MRLHAAGLPAAALAAQSYPPAFPRTNAAKLLDTDRIVVWDIVWPKGASRRRCTELKTDTPLGRPERGAPRRLTVAPGHAR